MYLCDTIICETPNLGDSCIVFCDKFSIAAESVGSSEQCVGVWESVHKLCVRKKRKPGSWKR